MISEVGNVRHVGAQHRAPSESSAEVVRSNASPEDRVTLSERALERSEAQGGARRGEDDAEEREERVYGRPQRAPSEAGARGPSTRTERRGADAEAERAGAIAEDEDEREPRIYETEEESERRNIFVDDEDKDLKSLFAEDEEEDANVRGDGKAERGLFERKDSERVNLFAREDSEKPGLGLGRERGRGRGLGRTDEAERPGRRATDAAAAREDGARTKPGLGPRPGHRATDESARVGLGLGLGATEEKSASAAGQVREPREPRLPFGEGLSGVTFAAERGTLKVEGEAGDARLDGNDPVAYRNTETRPGPYRSAQIARGPFGARGTAARLIAAYLDGEPPTRALLDTAS